MEAKIQMAKKLFISTLRAADVLGISTMHLTRLQRENPEMFAPVIKQCGANYYLPKTLETIKKSGLIKVFKSRTAPDEIWV
jgi:hypothetical protein